jgi:transcriptional regulator with XRE-family HTH domain
MTSEIQVEGGLLMTMLKRHRLVKGLTLGVLAKRIGVTASACSKWETGRSMPSARLIPKLAKVLDIDAMELTRLISPDPAPSTD